MRKKWFFVLALIVSMAILGACAAPASPSPSPVPASPSPSPEPASPSPSPSPPDATPSPTGSTDLDGTEWTLVTLNGAEVIEGSTITLNFTDGQVSGDAGCNSYSGQYTAADGTITMAEIINTEVFCQEPAGVMDQETAYLDALRTAAIYTITDNTLEIMSAADVRLVYQRADASPAPDETATAPSTTELDGTAWLLIEINGSAVIEGTAPTLIFEENGGAGGNGGCNSFGGQYTVGDDDAITFSDIVSTLMLCAGPEGVNEQEQAYFEALQSAATYRLDGDRLEIGNAAGDTTLVFNRGQASAGPDSSTSTDDLSGTAWTLVSLNGTDVLTETQVTINFESGTVKGSGGCIGYGGTYEIKEQGRLTLGLMEITAMGCDPRRIIEQEEAYTFALTNISKYEIVDDQLILTGGEDDSIRLVLRSQSAAPEPTATASTTSDLDETQWLLTSLNGADLITDSTVLLRFINGNELAGETGCNSYFARYDTSGDTFALTSELEKTTFPCDAADVKQQETAYFEALSNMATYRRTDDQLVLADATGSKILVFARKHPPTIDPALKATDWELATLNGQPPLAGTRITLQWNDDGYGGFGGCNGYGGTWRNGATIIADGGVLQLDEFAMTDAGCGEPEGVMEQERRYAETLVAAAAYTVTPERLEIKNAAGETTLIFNAQQQLNNNPADLIGTRWKLTLIDGQAPPAEGTYTLFFDSATEASGVAGCRSFNATYEATDDDLYFPSTEMTSLECMRPRATAQEIYFFEGTGTRYRLGPDQLEIFPVEGGSLVFERLPEDAVVDQQPTVWMLEAFEENGSSTPALANAEITLQFDGDTLREQGKIAGSAGCNRYTGPYTYVNEFTLGAIAVTRMACPPPIMEQEQRFLDVLQAVKTYSLEDQLRLQTADGRALVFRARAR